MKALLINGSPKEKGKTFVALSAVERKLHEEQIDVEVVSLANHGVRGCLGCFACHRTDEAFTCVQKDDGALEIMQSMIEASIVIYASPVYGLDISAQMKALIDRHNMLYKWSRPGTTSLLTGKIVGLLLTVGGPGGDAIEPCRSIFRHLFSEVFHAEIVGTYTAANSFAPEYRERVEKVCDQLITDLRPILMRERK
jgi:Multimeric flavodoxin WrbA